MGQQEDGSTSDSVFAGLSLRSPSARYVATASSTVYAPSMKGTTLSAGSAKRSFTLSSPVQESS